jgi:threonine/homoserine/homoserine lactone efflux protein
MSLVALVTLAGVMLMGAMSPGPDFVLVVLNSLSAGRTSGMFCAMGIGVGILVWAVAAAVGVAGLLAASATLFSLVKLFGAAYLIYLGVRALLSAASKRVVGLEPEAGAALGRRSAFLQGLVTNLLNPKTAVFFVALLPQFLPREATVLSVVELCLLTATVTVSWFTILAVSVGTLRSALVRPRIRRVIDAVTGTFLVGLGARIAAQR